MVWKSLTDEEVKIRLQKIFMAIDNAIMYNKKVKILKSKNWKGYDLL